MFSVRSESDLGVGEFLDLKLLVDWAVDSGFHLVQLLPINDTSVHGMWWDSYPYRYTFNVPFNFLVLCISFFIIFLGVGVGLEIEGIYNFENFLKLWIAALFFSLLLLTGTFVCSQIPFIILLRSVFILALIIVRNLPFSLVSESPSSVLYFLVTH